MSTHRAPRRGGRRRAAPARSSRRTTAIVTICALAVTLTGVGGWQLWERHRLTTGTVTRIAPAVATGTDLDERRVPLSACQASDDEPRMISLGSLNVSGCIQKVGVTDQQLEAPGNIHVAGWYTGSEAPGSKGLSIIDGHSSGRYKDGIFNKLDEFERGSIFTVEYGDGSIRRFEVTSVQSHEVDDTMTSMRSDARKEDANLALITCGGTYDAARHAYDKRIVVLAVNA